MESCILLDLKALHKGTWKMSKFMVFSHHLVMQVTPELRTLLKVVPKVHPELQAMLIDAQQYKNTWVAGGTLAMPKELGFTISTKGKWEDEPDELVDLDTMHCAKSTLGKVSLSPKAHFALGKVVHVHFDGRS